MNADVLCIHVNYFIRNQEKIRQTWMFCLAFMFQTLCFGAMCLIITLSRNYTRSRSVSKIEFIFFFRKETTSSILIFPSSFNIKHPYHISVWGREVTALSYFIQNFVHSQVDMSANSRRGRRVWNQIAVEVIQVSGSREAFDRLYLPCIPLNASI